MANRPKRDEASEVKAALTIADTAAQEALLVPLLEHLPHVCLRAEEDTPSVARFPRSAPASVVIDPIDGTLRFYLEGLGPYAVMAGLVVEGAYRAALVALPREEVFLDAVAGAGARRERGDGGARPVRARSEGRRVWVSHDLPEAALRVLRGRGLEPAPASGGAISVAPLVPGVRAGLRLVRGEGGGVSIRGRIGALIAAEAGALVRGAVGEPFPRQIDAPAPALLVAADADTLAALREAAAAGLA